MSSSASSGRLPLISPHSEGSGRISGPSAPATGPLPHPEPLPPPVPGPLPPPCPAISPAGPGSPSHAVAAAAPRPAHWAGPSSDSRADATTNPWSLRPPTGTEPTAAGSASPTGPGWSARSGPGPGPALFPTQPLLQFPEQSSWRTAPQTLPPSPRRSTRSPKSPGRTAGGNLNLGDHHLDRHFRTGDPPQAHLFLPADMPLPTINEAFALLPRSRPPPPLDRGVATGGPISGWPDTRVAAGRTAERPAATGSRTRCGGAPARAGPRAGPRSGGRRPRQRSPGAARR